MKKLLFLIPLVFLVLYVHSQPDVRKNLKAAFTQFESDPQLSHAISSLYVIKVSTGEVVFKKNELIVLAGASTQKIVTAATAFDLLGKDFRFKTQLGYQGTITGSVLNGNLYFIGSGDPTLGSWRWASTKDSTVLGAWAADLQKTGISSLKGKLFYGIDGYSRKTIPDGWIWQDLGNYYGAAPGILNWKENQQDLVLRSGKEMGSHVELVEPPFAFENEVKAAGKGSGDNAYAYLAVPPYQPLVTGTIPVNEPAFSISIADQSPALTLIRDFLKVFKAESGESIPAAASNLSSLKDLKIVSTYYSPSLDSMIYWFLKKSINLYGEALVKTLAYQKQGLGATDSGVQIVKNYWKQKGIDENELNIYDGSGLSPLNRLTTHAQVEVLRYAKSKDWYPYYLDAFPEYNGMKMKSGTITDVKGFCGYHTSKWGEEYIFSFLVNNYNGSTSSLVNKMFKVLDELK